jgi:hypothetical protein
MQLFRCISWSARFIFVIALVFTSPSFGQLITQSLTSSEGNTFSALFDTNTNFQWLSPVATSRQSISSVQNGFGGWINSGFRYASTAELMELYHGAGLSTDDIDQPQGQSWNNSNDVLAVQSIISGFGWTYENNAPTTAGSFGQRTLYGILSDTFLGDGQSPSSRQSAYLSATDSNGKAYTGGQWKYFSEDPAVGSFLVRDIPEPSILALFSLGLMGLVVFRKNRTRIE